MPLVEDCICISVCELQGSLSWETVKLWCRASSMHFVTTSQFFDPHSLCPTDLRWEQNFLLCLHLPLSYHQPGRGFCFSGKDVLRDCPSQQDLRKISSTQSEEVVVRALLSSSPFDAALLTRVVCFWGFTCCNLLAEILSFLKKYSVISFNITAVWFWYKFLTEYAGGWNHHTVCLCSSGIKISWWVVSPVWVPVSLDRQVWEQTWNLRALGEFSFLTLWVSIQGSGIYSIQCF